MPVCTMFPISAKQEITLDSVDNEPKSLAHEIVILHRLITNLSSKIEDFQEQKQQTDNEVAVLKRVIIQFDKSSTYYSKEIAALKKQNEEYEDTFKKMRDMLLQMADENDAFNHDLNTVYEITQRTNLQLNQIEEKMDIPTTEHPQVPMGTPVIDISERSSESSSSPLTKRQKLSRKKHDWRKKKILKQRITGAQNKWTQENGYSAAVMGLTFI